MCLRIAGAGWNGEMANMEWSRAGTHNGVRVQTYNGVRGCSPQRGPRTEPLVSESGVQCSLAENILALEHSIELQ